MSTARIFKSGNSQAVRLPKEFRFRAQEVEIFRRGGEEVEAELKLSDAGVQVFFPKYRVLVNVKLIDDTTGSRA